MIALRAASCWWLIQRDCSLAIQIDTKQTSVAVYIC